MQDECEKKKIMDLIFFVFISFTNLENSANQKRMIGHKTPH